MFNIGERESEKEEEKWVGDEIDAMKDNILFFSSLWRKKNSLNEEKKRTLDANFNVVFICTFTECY